MLGASQKQKRKVVEARHRKVLLYCLTAKIGKRLVFPCCIADFAILWVGFFS